MIIWYNTVSRLQREKAEQFESFSSQLLLFETRLMEAKGNLHHAVRETIKY